jgi:hypothetical protein
MGTGPTCTLEAPSELMAVCLQSALELPGRCVLMSGVFKSSVAALLQQHFGVEWTTATQLSASAPAAFSWPAAWIAAPFRATHISHI